MVEAWHAWRWKKLVFKGMCNFGADSLFLVLGFFWFPDNTSDLCIHHMNTTPNAGTFSFYSFKKKKFILI